MWWPLQVNSQSDGMVLNRSPPRTGNRTLFMWVENGFMGPELIDQKTELVSGVKDHSICLMSKSDLDYFLINYILQNSQQTYICMWSVNEVVWNSLCHSFKNQTRRTCFFHYYYYCTFYYYCTLRMVCDPTGRGVAQVRVGSVLRSYFSRLVTYA